MSVRSEVVPKDLKQEQKRIELGFMGRLEKRANFQVIVVALLGNGIENSVVKTADTDTCSCQPNSVHLTP